MPNRRGRGEPSEGAPTERRGRGEPSEGAPTQRRGRGEPSEGAPTQRRGRGEPSEGAPTKETDQAKSGPEVARARVPLVEREKATPAQQAAGDKISQSRGPVAGPFAALPHSPEPTTSIAATGHYLRFDGPMPLGVPEIA